MTEATSKGLVGYFRAFANEKNYFFVYGSAKKLNECLQNILPEQYPILHLERPNIDTRYNDTNLTEEFHCQINAFARFKRDGTPEENNASELEAEAVSVGVLQELQKRLHHDARNDDIDFVINGNAKDPIFDTYLPNHLGWQLRCTVVLQANERLC